MSAVQRQHSKSRENCQEDKSPRTVESHYKLLKKHHRAILMHN